VNIAPSVERVTYDFATTSTNWPGTKWIADKVVPAKCEGRDTMIKGF
jgi:hypothetical protein